MSRVYENALAFLKRHERPLATTLFLTGFIGDLLTFGLLNLSSVTLLFAGYLVIVSILTLVAHVTHEQKGRVSRTLAVLAPLFAQFTFGSLLSGFLIFYTKSAVLSVSWPFIILLGLIFLGNEYFRNYRDRLIFQTLLVYFSFYAFAIFALPLYTNRLGTIVFLESTAITICVFFLYLFVFALSGWERLRSAFKSILISVTVITLLIVSSYLAGLLPPIPLTLKSGGIYHTITREGTEYILKGEHMRPWWDPRVQVVHHMPGTPLYAYSAIFAPGAFSTNVMHVWQSYDEKSRKWITMSTIAFNLSGGREGGYRGYSLKYDPAPGAWRVLVQTIDGQTIGKFTFTVENSTTTPSLSEQRL